MNKYNDGGNQNTWQVKVNKTGTNGQLGIEGSGYNSRGADLVERDGSGTVLNR